MVDPPFKVLFDVDHAERLVQNSPLKPECEACSCATGKYNFLGSTWPSACSGEAAWCDGRLQVTIQDHVR